MATSGKKRIRVSNEGQIFEIEVDDDDDEEDEIEQLQTQEEDVFKWTRKSTNLLIKSRLQMDAEFLNPSLRKSKLWQKISNILKASSFYVEASKCDDKWRNLLQTYRKIKYRPSGVVKASSWEYFHLMDKVLANSKRGLPQRRFPDSSLNFRSSGRAEVPDNSPNFRNSGRTEVPDSSLNFRNSGRTDVTETVSQLQQQYSSDSSYDEEELPTLNFEGCSSVPVCEASNGKLSHSAINSGLFTNLPSDPPHWLGYVMERLDQRDRRKEERENERWNKLMGAIESLQKVEIEKVKALNNLTGTLERYLAK